MSGSGGGKPGVRAFWDHESNTIIPILDGSNSINNSFESVIVEMNSHIQKLEKRIEQLEAAYIEDKLLSPDPGKIDS